MKFLKPIALGMILVFVGWLVANATISLKPDSTAAAQDVRTLDNRITMLEQRLFSIQTSINRLEQFAISQRSTGGRDNALDGEINQLRQEFNNLTRKSSDIECGLLKLDERTTRRPPRTTTDPCRLNPNSPIQLPARP